MRVIKLSPEDVDMRDRDAVTTFFQHELPQRGWRFLLTKGRVASNALEVGDLLVFTYRGELVYVAIAGSDRGETPGDEASTYPYYFLIQPGSVHRLCGRLTDLEDDLRAAGLCEKSVSRSRGWPVIDEADDRRRKLESIIDPYREREQRGDE